MVTKLPACIVWAAHSSGSNRQQHKDGRLEPGEESHAVSAVSAVSTKILHKFNKLPVAVALLHTVPQYPLWT